MIKIETESFFIGREMYGFFKYRYYIKIDNVKDYYYSKALFVKRAFELIDNNPIDQMELEDILNQII